MPTNRRTIFAWCLYDFANSAFTTLVVTFIYAAFFTKVIAPDEVTGTWLWSRSVSITAVTVGLLSPLLGALADRGGYRKRFLGFFTLVAVVGACLLYTAMPGQVFKALFWFTVGNIAFEMGGVFYNAFLPDVAPPDRIGRISGYGWALGYVGGLTALGLALVGFVDTDTPWFGLSKEAYQHIRATNLLVAGWFAVFSLPLFLWVGERPARPGASGAPLSDSFRRLATTLREIRRYPDIVRLLLARLFYADGLNTVFAFGGIYAAGTFGFTFEELLFFGMVLNVAAGLGAFALGFVDDWLGGKRTIQISLLGFVAATATALLTGRRMFFWGAGLLIGLCGGPNQAASRSLMGRFVPADKRNEFYGLFAFSGKATAFMGPFLLGELTRFFGSQRAGMAVVLVFFVIGLALIQPGGRGAGEAAGGGDGDSAPEYRKRGLDAVVHLQLGEDAGYVSPDRALADEHSSGDLIVAESLGQELQDLQLPPGEALYPVRLLPRRIGVGLGGNGREITSTGQLLVDPYSAAMNRAHRLEQRLRSHILQDVATGPGLGRVGDDVRVFVRREDHRPGFRVSLFHLQEGLDSVPAGHRDV